MLVYNAAEGELKFDFVHNTRVYSDKLRGQTFCDVYYQGQRIATGVTTCGTDDNFSKRRGRKIALKRALAVVSKYFDVSKVDREDIWKEYHKKMA